jgi:hypothetical protein
MDKIQKHNSFNTNTPSSESYKSFLDVSHLLFLVNGRSERTLAKSETMSFVTSSIHVNAFLNL